MAHAKAQRKKALRDAFQRKAEQLSLSLRALARDLQVGHSQLAVRWARYKAAGNDAERDAACANC